TPGGAGLARGGLRLAPRAPAAAAPASAPAPPQHSQVLGGLRLPEAQRPGHVVDRPLAGGEQVEDLAAPGFGDRVEDVGGRRPACHADNIFRYGNVSRSVAEPSRWRDPFSETCG